MAITPDVMGTFAVPVTPKTDAGADSYMEISFTSAAGSIPAGLTATIQNRFHKNNYSGSYVQADDYSFNPAFTSFTAWDHVTLYRNGTLVWGVEP
jgi:hypothetical protein